MLYNFLIFLDPSKIDQAPSNKTIVEGSNVTLHCNATGSPASNITWTKDGSPTALHEGEQYAISNISRQQHGNYKCTAWNGVGEQSKTSFSINVLCKQFQGNFFLLVTVCFIGSSLWWKVIIFYKGLGRWAEIVLISNQMLLLTMQFNMYRLHTYLNSLSLTHSLQGILPKNLF